MNWDLSRLYAGFDDDNFVSDMTLLRDMIDGARTCIDNLADGDDEVESLRAVVERLQAIQDLENKLSAMVYLSLAADSDCTQALSPRQRLQELDNEISLLFHDFTRAVGGNPRLDELCAADPVLTEHAPMLRRCREEQAHLIDPALEPVVLRMKITGGEGWVRLRDELFAGLSIDMNVDGEHRTLPLSAVRALAYDPRAEVRHAAYEAELGAYPLIETPMAACLSNIFGEANTLAELKHYPSVLDWSLTLNRMDRAVLDALLTAVRGALPLFREYFRIKAKLLGYDGGLKFWDLFAPVGNCARHYTLDEARDLLLDVFGSHNPEIAGVMRRAFDERWIDAYPRPGKEGGAFCNPVHALGMSYVLTNFDGNLSDISVLAHELGHAYHGECLRDVPALLTDTPSPLAETASTFNELLLAEELLARTDDADERVRLADQQLSEAAQVIVDILSRFLFESNAIERRKQSALTAADFCELMRKAQLDSYGDGLDPASLHPYMWACKPHYYDTTYHFYNYPYAFGLLFASGLLGKYREQGKAFWPQYWKILRFSGSGTVREVAAEAGIDLSDQVFWHKSLELFEEKLEILKAYESGR